MEASYIIIPLVDFNENAFNNELNDLFPLCKNFNIVYNQQRLLIVYKDIEALLYKVEAEKEVYEYDSKIESFSRRHPYLDIAVIQVLGEEDNFFYDGYVMKNKKKLLEHSGMYDAHIPILRYLIPTFEGKDFNVFLYGA